jgi:hypothetical protein
MRGVHEPIDLIRYDGVSELRTVTRSPRGYALFKLSSGRAIVHTTPSSG